MELTLDQKDLERLITRSVTQSIPRRPGYADPVVALSGDASAGTLTAKCRFDRDRATEGGATS